MFKVLNIVNESYHSFHKLCNPLSEKLKIQYKYYKPQAKKVTTQVDIIQKQRENDIGRGKYLRHFNPLTLKL
jgi:hypothetical protein